MHVGELLIHVTAFTIMKTLAMEIDYRQSSNIYYCETSREIINIVNPYNEEIVKDITFVNLTWLVKRAKNVEERAMEYFTTAIPFSADYGVYKFWGLEVKRVYRDITSYSARLYLRNEVRTTVFSMEFNVPPKLKSAHMYIIEDVNLAIGIVTYSCGQIGEYGNPGVKVVWRSEEGHKTTVKYSNGFANITVSASGAGHWACGMDRNAPAFKCILNEDLPRWEDVHVGEHMRDNNLIMKRYPEYPEPVYCRKSMAAGQDKMVYTGTLISNKSTIDGRHWVDFQVRNPRLSLEFTSMCSIDIKGSQCQGRKQGHECYCVRVSDEEYRLVANVTAKHGYSQNYIRLWWPDSPKDKAHGQPSSSDTLPFIESPKNPDKIVLQMNYDPISHDNCLLHIKQGRNYTFTFCALNLRQPMLKIAFDKKDAGVQPARFNCSTRSVLVQEDHLGAYYTFSFYEEEPGCVRSDSISCLIDEQKSIALFASLVVIIPVATLLFGSVIIYFCWSLTRQDGDDNISDATTHTDAYSDAAYDDDEDDDQYGDDGNGDDDDEPGNDGDDDEV